MRKILFSLLVTITLFSCEKQVEVATLGEQVPNYTFANLLNSAKETISLKNLKGKTVILEFWATWCGPCIPAMKKLDSLQKEFKDDLKVIAISNEDRVRLDKYIKSTNNSLTIASDTTHASIFKYQIIPHSIIIDREGIVRAITSPENISKEAINDLITKKTMDLELKDDFYKDPNFKIETLKKIANAHYRIELKSYDQDQRGGYKILKDDENEVKGLEIWNSTIPRLYQTLFEVSSPSRIVYKDSLTEDDFPYEQEHQYNLLIEASPEYQDRWRILGVDFLNQYFGVNAQMSVDSLECFVLKDLDHTITESTSDTSEYMFMGPILKTKKIKMSKLADYLENFTPIPVLDKTELQGDYDIELEWQSEDPKTLHSELKKYGLVLERSEGKLPVEVMEIYKKRLKD